MRRIGIRIRKFAIFCHRWMGVAFCLLFAWWFLSGIFVMYCDFPTVRDSDYLTRSPALDPAKIHVEPAEAYARLGLAAAPFSLQLLVEDNRPLYRFDTTAGRRKVHADDGSVQGEYSQDVLLRMAAQWTGRQPGEAKAEQIKTVDQWTIRGGFRGIRPVWKYSFPDGQQIYISGRSGEVIQYTTFWSRVGAYLGPIPHWLYFTPLRTRPELWRRIVIWSSGAGTIMALLGLGVGLSLYSPSKRFRIAGEATSIPYTGQRRLHTILGLFFGIVTCTWSFSGMLSMEPFRMSSSRRPNNGGSEGRIETVLTPPPFRFTDYSGKPPEAALVQARDLKVKSLDFTAFDEHPAYIAALSPHESRVIPVDGAVRKEFDTNRIFQMIANAAKPIQVEEQRMMTRYDSYYLDRHGDLPLPIVFVRLRDFDHTQIYVDQRTGRLSEEHSDASSWAPRWLYHGLHSLDFPLLYNYRPAWDIVVLTLMFGGLALSVTSIIIGWQMLRRKFLKYRPKTDTLFSQVNTISAPAVTVSHSQSER